MKKSISKKEAEKQIEEFFHHIKDKTPKDVKKIKKLAMSYNIKLKGKKKAFCKKCFRPFKEPSIRIKNGIVSFTCEFCKHQNRWKFRDRPELPEGNEEECC